MEALNDAAGKVTDNLLTHGPIGILALVGWMCAIVACMGMLVLYRAVRASEAARFKQIEDALDASEKERAEVDRKMDRLQAVLEARR